MLDSLGLEETAHLDRAGGGEAAVAVHEQRNVGAEGPADRRHDLLRPPRPLVDVMAALGAHAKFEGIEAELISQLRKSGRLVPRGDVALHGRGVCARLPRLTAPQRHDRLAFDLSAQIPQGGIEAGHRPLEIGARELVLLFLDAVQQPTDGEGVGAQSPGRHLAVKDLRGDVRVVGGQLPPPLRSVFGRYTHEADVSSREGFQAIYEHVAPHSKTITFRRASPRLTEAIASLIPSSGYRPEINSSSLRTPSS